MPIKERDEIRALFLHPPLCTSFHRTYTAAVASAGRRLTAATIPARCCRRPQSLWPIGHAIYGRINEFFIPFIPARERIARRAGGVEERASILPIILLPTIEDSQPGRGIKTFSAHIQSFHPLLSRL